MIPSAGVIPGDRQEGNEKSPLPAAQLRVWCRPGWIQFHRLPRSLTPDGGREYINGHPYHKHQQQPASTMPTHTTCSLLSTSIMSEKSLKHLMPVVNTCTFKMPAAAGVQHAGEDFITISTSDCTHSFNLLT